MTVFKRLFCISLALCIIVGMAACKKNKGGKDDSSDMTYSDVESGYSSNTEENYNDTVSDWKDDAAATPNGGNTSDSFDNTTADTPVPKPGTDSNAGTSQTDKPTTTPIVNSGKPMHPKLELSALSNSENLQYYYEGSNYAYGITKNGYEYIAFRDEAGYLYDVMSGGGKLLLKNVNKVQLLSVSNVKAFSSTMQDSYYSVEVEYNMLLGGVKSAKVIATYIFKENCISYTTQIIVDSTTDISASNSTLTRGFTNGYIDCSATVHEKWVYPENGDYPYPDFESFVMKHQIDDTLWCYSSLRGENCAQKYNTNNFNTSNVPLNFENTKGLMYNLTYDISFVDTAVDGEAKDYLGLFRGLNSEIAVGIAPISEGYGSTIFEGDKAQLNLNVTNLTDNDLKFSLRYDIRDYYGNIVDAGIFIDSNVYKYADANRTITVKAGNYGIYYLNLYAMTKYSSYSECYPFALIEKYDYKYFDTSPFGIATTIHSTDRPEISANAAYWMTKCGVANYRKSSVTQEVKNLQSLGITQFNGHLNPVNDEIDEVDDYVEKALAKVKELSGVIDSIEIGNEMSLEASRVGGRSLEELYPLFYNCTFMPTYKAIKKLYPDLLYIPCPFSACEQNWINMFSEGFIDSDGNGIADKDSAGNLIRNPENQAWSDVEVVATHIYGIQGLMPDQYSENNPFYGNAMWNIEGGMQRMEAMFEQHRSLRNGKPDPLFYLTEVGMNTAQGITTTAGLRAQADYITRMGIMCVAYGVDRVQF